MLQDQEDWWRDYGYGTNRINLYRLPQKQVMYNRMKSLSAGFGMGIWGIWTCAVTFYALTNDPGFTQTFFFRCMLPGIVGFLISQIILIVASHIANRQSKVKELEKERDIALQKLQRIKVAVENDPTYGNAYGYRDHAGSGAIINDIKEILK